MGRPARSNALCQSALLLAFSVLCSPLCYISVDAFVHQRLFWSKSKLLKAAAASGDAAPIVVTLTREEGKNEKLKKKIDGNSDLREQIDVLEIPCIEHAVGPDYERLSSLLLSEEWDYVAITSPEAANVLASAWDTVQDNPPPVVAVGKATEEKLQSSGIQVAFVPSKATAKTLAKELKLLDEGKPTSVLYPASAKAKKVLQNDLASRGFAVTRINTYDTVTAAWADDQIETSKRVQVACFGSPSAVEGWLKNTGENTGVFAACIGGTSATACKELGWEENQIFFPEAPGLDGWVEAIRKAIEAAKHASPSVV
mmetsp:Transcript_12522/g.26489  ORF Transcript_12522/g.26489 Transcript_12522/m.26489 type:complete len:313 (-) Transcript_12522:103-1041(-)|eukprot:CAMPEP_0201124204 /NCGR_PEP_ID=MMETSP0850-20130426/10615_1 /ASSEMBLY_ACC=CAM_ASM_000622 /TAXON_ID=183588 /ORGANISM="Pseudo-nitzschia fraudulenta, Strain WWA7" /LENGTH=312 /DNA_ID=CAMNT_0047391403 /DNA_START=37 /DNA_END=975 /DNA_ORIENTATION=+